MRQHWRPIVFALTLGALAYTAPSLNHNEWSKQSPPSNVYASRPDLLLLELEETRKTVDQILRERAKQP
jgi:hypothetical protein